MKIFLSLRDRASRRGRRIRREKPLSRALRKKLVGRKCVVKGVVLFALTYFSLKTPVWGARFAFQEGGDLRFELIFGSPTVPFRTENFSRKERFSGHLFPTDFCLLRRERGGWIFSSFLFSFKAGTVWTGTSAAPSDLSLSFSLSA